MNNVPVPPPAKKPLAKLPPKDPVQATAPNAPQRRNKLVQAVDPDRIYTLNRSGVRRGKKIVIYGDSGMGKTTAACLAPDPVFVAADDGVDVVMHPSTGEEMPRYMAPTYQDVRNILGNHKHFEGFKTVVLDTMTMAEEKAVPHILDTVLKEGRRVNSLEGYGWGAGYQYLAEHDNYLKYDLQSLVDAGFNVVVLCQMAPRKVASAEVEEYLKDGPKLVWRPGSKAYAVTDFVEWADYCFKIGYSSVAVKSKRVSGSNERVFFVHPQMHFEAKARDIPARFPAIAFSSPEDDSIWRFVFDQAWKDVSEEEVQS